MRARLISTPPLRRDGAAGQARAGAAGRVRHAAAGGTARTTGLTSSVDSGKTTASGRCLSIEPSYS